jgi:hypothetical protein
VVKLVLGVEAAGMLNEGVAEVFAERANRFATLRTIAI